MHNQATPNAQANARALRSSMTDERRDAYLRSQGFSVLPFATDQPFLNIEGVLSVITSELATRSPHPNLPPEGKESISRNLA